MKRYDAFISYSSKDMKQAFEVRDFLAKQGVNCWMAPDSIPIGSNYAEEIPKGIDGSTVFILLLSENSQQSSWVPKELLLALDKGKSICPFEISKCNLSEPFKFLLINIQIDYDINNLLEKIKELKDKVLKDNESISKCFHGWFGPNRKTFTWKDRAPYAVFNSITNNPYYGDERYFVKIREYIEGQETPYVSAIKIEKGKQYDISIFYHNNAEPNNIGQKAIGIANGVAIRSSFPAVIQGKEYISADIIANDTFPITVWACVEITADEPCYLRYVQGSAAYKCKGQLNGNNPGPEYLFGVGSFIGYNKISGILPGGDQYAGSVIYRLFADYPDYKVKISSWVDKTEDNYDIHSVMIRYENIGTMDQSNVVIKAVLESNSEYISGSSYLSNNNFHKKVVNDDVVAEYGMNIGDYAGGDGWAEIEFKVATPKKSSSGTKIEAVVSTDDGNKRVRTVL